MKSNLNPLYALQEAHFLSGEIKNAGKKMFKNGAKKNGLFTTLKRNKLASELRGKHVAKLRNSNLGRGGYGYDEAEMLKDIGKRAVKGQHLSTKQAKALKKGYVGAEF